MNNSCDSLELFDGRAVSKMVICGERKKEIHFYVHYLGKEVNKAIARCIREDVLREFLVRRRGEVTQLDYTFDRRIELEREDVREEERVNTERERQRAEEERRAKKLERQRAEVAEKEVQKLRAELEQYKRQFSKAGNQDFPG